MNKVVMTGHCEGIGKAIHKYLSKHNYSVIGYDTQVNLNLHETEVYSKFLEDCKDASIIILNAHTGEQHLCLRELYLKYSSYDKHVIVFGSMASRYWKTNSEVMSGMEKYWEQKKWLDKEVEFIQKSSRTFRVSIIRPSWVETNLSSLYGGSKLSVSQVIDAFDFIIKNKDKHILTVELECTN